MNQFDSLIFNLVKMKKLVLSMSLLVALTNATMAQYSENFESNPSSFISVTNGGFGFTASGNGNDFVNGNSSSSGRPASVAYAKGGFTAYKETEGTGILTSDNLSTVGANFVALSFKLQAFSLNRTNDGMDAADYVRVEVSPDGGLTWMNTLEVRGLDNSWWSYDASGSANANYDGDNIPATTSAIIANNNNPSGPGTVVVRNLPVGISNLKIRISLSCGNDERWVIDDVLLNRTTNGPLPVNFANVNAKQTGNNIAISWSNLTESDINYYIVERSTDGSNFAAIGKVQPKANDYRKQDYSFTDVTPNQTNFYRIKAVEYNSNIKSSVILKISSGKMNKEISVYPNPVQNKTVTLHSNNISAGNYSVQVVDANGQQVFLKTMNLQAGSLSQSLELPAGTRPGTYMLKIVGAEIKSVTTLFVQ
jgi:hypothetical protein